MSNGVGSSNDLNALKEQLAALQAVLSRMEQGPAGADARAPAQRAGGGNAGAANARGPAGARCAKGRSASSVDGEPQPAAIAARQTTDGALGQGASQATRRTGKKETGKQPSAKQAANQSSGESQPQEDGAGNEEEDDAAVRHGLNWRFQQMGAWTLSVIIHLAIIIVLGLSMLPFVLESEPPELTALQTRPEEELNQVLEQNLTPSESESLVSPNSALQTGHQTAMQSLSEPSFDKTTAESLEGPKVKFDNLSLSGVQGSQLMINTSDEAPGDPHAVVDGYDQAMDRITHEILMMLEKSKVLVVWLFDESESMKDDQKEIAARIHKVYQELDSRGATQNAALLTGIVSYGGSFHVLTEKPTADLDRIRAAIGAVPVEKSGKEMMCLAVGSAIHRYRSAAAAGKRQMALILVTDESGDSETNVTMLEPAIAEARAARCRIYTLGREAVFGYPYAHMFWRHPQTGHLHLLPIDRGPETPFVEQLQTSGFQARKDGHGSGFGPYEQARLARETGGIFFMLPSVETNLVREGGNALEEFKQGKINQAEYVRRAEMRRFTLEALRPYMPSLESRGEYAKERDVSPLRAGIWTVINILNPYKPEIAKHINLRMEFAPTPQAFFPQAQAELLKTKQYFIFLDQAEQEMEKMQKLRKQEIYPRWQANYDLLYAQLLAYKVRVYEYGAYLENFCKNPPKDIPLQKPAPGKKVGFLRLAHWYMSHRSETITGDLTKESIERSAKMFNDIIQNHPNTPWRNGPNGS